MLDEEERIPRAWAATPWPQVLGVGLLLKSLIGLVFPLGAAILYLLLTRQLFSWRIWKRLRPFSRLRHHAARRRSLAYSWPLCVNPPYFSLHMRSVPGEYHGFLWFYFINEQLLRFLNLRYPRDYDTVPRLYFWLFHPGLALPLECLSARCLQALLSARDRAGQAPGCWPSAGPASAVFFTFSTTQEYYSMPCLPGAWRC